jgi:hypothetical protein
MATCFRIPLLKLDGYAHFGVRPVGSKTFEKVVEERDIHIWLGRLYVCLERPGWRLLPSVILAEKAREEAWERDLKEYREARVLREAAL